MTACVKNHSKRVALAISASLVGALSLGAAAPAVAFAANEGIQPLISEADAVDQGKITKAENGQLEAYTMPEKGMPEFAAGTGQYLVPVEFTPYESNPIAIDTTGAKANASVVYTRKSDSTKVERPDINWLTAGEYTLSITFIGGEYDGQTYDIDFKVVEPTLADATIFNAANGNEDVTETEFEWAAGNPMTVGFAVDGDILPDTTYEVEYAVEGDKFGSWLPDAPIEPGSYVAVLFEKGVSKDEANVAKQIPFKVNKLDLTTATISISDIAQKDASPNAGDAVVPQECTINGYYIAAGWVDIKVNDETYGNTGNGVALGNYTVTITPTEDNGVSRMTGYATSSFNVVTTKLTAPSFMYEGVNFVNHKEHGGDPSTVEVDLSDSKSLFRESDLSVEYFTNDIPFTVTYTDAFGNPATAADLQTAGTWKVNVRANAAETEFAYGSDVHTLTVYVTAGEIEEGDAFFRYKGDVTDSVSTVYDGTDVMEDIESVLRLGGETLVEGEDYQVVITKGGQEVDQIVDAGTYTLTIVADGYDLSKVTGDLTMTVTVSPLNLVEVIAKSDLMVTFDDGNRNAVSFIPYTGEAIEPNFRFVGIDKDGNEWELPEGTVVIESMDYMPDKQWDADFERDVNEMRAAGLYKLNLDLGHGVKNYTISDNEDMIWVNGQGVFLDVANDAWYSANVYTALKLSYMNGYADTQLFGPDQSITRGDVAVVLFKMAGGTLAADDENASTSDKYFETPFSDVDAEVYYAQAVQWAEKAGIVTGYDGTDLFMPESPVSRQELATMLARYAKLTGKDVSADLSVLDAYTDGASVADFADEAVAWAVEADIMGQDVTALRPADAISRAEVATMAVRLQPENIDFDIMG